MTVTATSIAKMRIQEILFENSGKVFRISVSGGGCSGLQYAFDLTESQDDDIVISEGIVVDPMSNLHIDGSVLDFKDEIFNKTFVLENPNMRTCGCGKSFGM
jgi:iron-sulfur cluster assembly accessory protein